MSNGTDIITRKDLVRAIQATRRSLLARATGIEALELLAGEIADPHSCESIYSDGDDGPCLHCGERVAS